VATTLLLGNSTGVREPVPASWNPPTTDLGALAFTDAHVIVIE